MRGVAKAANGETLQGDNIRAKPTMWESVTTIPKGSTSQAKLLPWKRPTPQAGEEIVYSPWRHGVSRKDGDLVMLTDNDVLVSNIRPTRTIFCIQRNATKVIPTEETQVASNLASFGDDIGKTTNKVTAMYDVQSLFDEESREYKELEYRIMSGQL